MVTSPGTYMTTDSLKKNSMNESNQSSEALAELLTLTVVVDERGNTKYHNHLGQLHRVHGPAAIYTTGDQYWLQHGRYHRTDGPAVIWGDGSQEWWINGARHREGGPAVLNADGSCRWYLRGCLHRGDGPAIEASSGARAPA